MIILISGKARSGKDTVAHMIQELTGGKLKRVGLADALKEEYRKSTGGMPWHILEELKNSVPQIREQLILLGQARKILNGNMNYWLDQLPKDNILVSDTRYTEEVDYFTENCIKIRIECPREIRAQRGKLSNENHPSETNLDDYKGWDFMIDGSKSKDAVTEQVASILKQLNLV